jgi:hypothetical protein
MPRADNVMPQVIYQIKVTLNGSKPPIWRRVLVQGDATLAKLHRILQIVMGWDDYHLHLFTVEGIEFGVPNPEMPVRSEKGIKLQQFIRGEKYKFRYEYDFGDSWQHILLVEKVMPPNPTARYPHCLTGKRACPPEDVGGIWGYVDFLEAIGNPEHSQHEELLEWIGGEFEPEAFDLEAVNRALAKIR